MSSGRRGGSCKSERPRERLAAQGPGALTDAELIAVAWDAVRGASALELAHSASPPRWPRRDAHGASRNARVGAACHARLAAGVELARRAAREALTRGDTLTCPTQCGIIFACARRAGQRGLRRPVPRQPASPDRRRRALPGTLAQTSVYPREIVKAALAHNAAAVIFAHNHPSGIAEPSRADELLTQSLKAALALVDVRTLDHFIVAGGQVVSFAERGML